MSLSDSWTARPAAINRQNAAEAVFEDLRGAIESGELSLGTRLPSEAALAERYGSDRARSPALGTNLGVDSNP
jgi:DNA-binding GntR family transcriptional regulator